MIFNKTKIKGLYIIEPELKIDNRGYFVEIFSKKEFSKKGLVFNIMRSCQSLTKKRGIIRGMHFQKESKAEIKIVQCLKGAIYDVAIDLRENSPTYGQYVSLELNEKNKKMFFIPKGFAHGFQTLVNNCQVQYFMSEIYSPEYASGVRWNDPFFNIKWPIKNIILSEKDKNWPLL
ncbi:MAG: dTDP-4-dehydrorhamnose 3,5-epimerase [Parcubacteria group bacterium Licking1014_1]|nr:MAG: dTDP-4-dehydrorhamnose 3,5-epimerase [Parcubacteria group bacterium Licking1014_1]